MNASAVLSELFATQTRQFAQIMGAFQECDEDIQAVVLEMVDIVNDESATGDEKDAATNTIVEALFPSLMQDMTQQERKARQGEAGNVLAEMADEESHFADRVNALMAQQGITQTELAEKVGVGQSAIANMLSRKSRPQRKTVARFAEAFGVDASELMP